MVSKIFNNETQRPSLVKVWQIPMLEALPKPLFVFFLLLPLEAQDTSYFAASASMLSFSLMR
ncbi:hypothetical protein JCM19301_1967 [Jejuia pallidilutea]|uniref:Uncharacterized protein n=1 Tax=Jejuia pallidilutea TaxID=504487 RepID=A0A090VUF9_9FLAO|nr:hypothetical protein JCM19301_1967 [Jejuia pallidilutea]